MKKLIVTATIVLVGCAKPPPPEAITVVEQAKTAADVVEYRKLLKPCHARAIDAGSYAVYTACADAVDREVCAKNGDRCK